jgi:hypothetical protein
MPALEKQDRSDGSQLMNVRFRLVPTLDGKAEQEFTASMKHQLGLGRQFG